MNFKLTEALKQLPENDRQRLKWVLLVLGAVLLWTFNVAPALKTLHDLPPQLLQGEAQTQSLQTLQAQAQALQKAPRIRQADALALLQKNAADVLGAGARLNAEGARVTLTLSGVSADNLAQFLALARSQSHALPVEAHLQKLAGSGPHAQAKNQVLWRGALILNLPST